MMRINFYFGEPWRWPEILRRRYWLSKDRATLHFEAFLELNDLLVVLILELLHEVVKLLYQPIINNCILFLLGLPQLLLLLEPLGYLLPQC